MKAPGEYTPEEEAEILGEAPANRRREGVTLPPPDIDHSPPPGLPPVATLLAKRKQPATEDAEELVGLCSLNWMERDRCDRRCRFDHHMKVKRVCTHEEARNIALRLHDEAADEWRRQLDECASELRMSLEADMRREMETNYAPRSWTLDRISLLRAEMADEVQNQPQARWAQSEFPPVEEGAFKKPAPRPAHDQPAGQQEARPKRGSRAEEKSLKYRPIRYASKSPARRSSSQSEPHKIGDGWGPKPTEGAEAFGIVPMEEERPCQTGPPVEPMDTDGAPAHWKGKAPQNSRAKGHTTSARHTPARSRASSRDSEDRASANHSLPTPPPDTPYSNSWGQPFRSDRRVGSGRGRGRILDQPAQGTPGMEGWFHPKATMGRLGPLSDADPLDRLGDTGSCSSRTPSPKPRRKSKPKPAPKMHGWTPPPAKEADTNEQEAQLNRAILIAVNKRRPANNLPPLDTLPENWLTYPDTTAPEDQQEEEEGDDEGPQDQAHDDQAAQGAGNMTSPLALTGHPAGTAQDNAVVVADLQRVAQQAVVGLTQAPLREEVGSQWTTVQRRGQGPSRSRSRGPRAGQSRGGYQGRSSWNPSSEQQMGLQFQPTTDRGGHTTRASILSPNYKKPRPPNPRYPPATLIRHAILNPRILEDGTRILEFQTFLPTYLIGSISGVKNLIRTQIKAATGADVFTPELKSFRNQGDTCHVTVGADNLTSLMGGVACVYTKLDEGRNRLEAGSEEEARLDHTLDSIRGFQEDLASGKVQIPKGFLP
ncbi:MAG: hypothetical protein GY696_33925 [Gammaproteobacteria bacterium]|nr:hypothetical protein [Gammaproteobacteria bacterium]